MFSCASGGTEVFTANVTVLRLEVRSPRAAPGTGVGPLRAAPQRHRRPASAFRRSGAPVLTKAGCAGRCIASRRHRLRAGAQCAPGLPDATRGQRLAQTLRSGRRHWRGACRTACQPRAGGRCAPAARCGGPLAQYTRGFLCGHDRSPRPHARAAQQASAASLGIACCHARNTAAFQLLWTCTDQPPPGHRAS